MVEMRQLVEPAQVPRVRLEDRLVRDFLGEQLLLELWNSGVLSSRSSGSR